MTGMGDRSIHIDSSYHEKVLSKTKILDRVMRIESLHVKNFKGFKERTWTFSQNFTLLVGENGSGKTSVLEALAITLEPYLPGFNPSPTAFPYSKEYIRLKQSVMGSATRFEPQHPSGTRITAFHYQDSYTGFRPSSGTAFTSEIQGNHLNDIWFGSNVEEQAAILPIAAYYSSNRLDTNPADQSNLTRQITNSSRFEVFKNCLDGKLAIPEIFLWLREEQYVSLQEGRTSPLLKTVTDAMCSCLMGAIKIEYNVRQRDVIIEFQNGSSIPYRNLSDGQKIMTALVADIAYRAAWLNPHLAENVLEETDGIILIDELDLHLHPKWQRRVVNDLKRTFPKIQFIATSHSPFIIQSLEPGELIVLDDDPQVEYSNRGLEEIVKFIQGVDQPHMSQRYIEQKEAAKHYFTLLRENRPSDDPELAQAKDILDSLTSQYADNPAADAFLEMKRLAKENSNSV